MDPQIEPSVCQYTPLGAVGSRGGGQRIHHAVAREGSRDKKSIVDLHAILGRQRAL